MREIRYFESDYAEAPARLVAVRPLTITTHAGVLWVTLDERPRDHWLKPGETISFATGESGWISGGSDRTVWVLAAVAPKTHTSLAASAMHLLRTSWRSLSAEGRHRDDRASGRRQDDDLTIAAMPCSK